jgi:hypothetical protein
LIKKSANNNVSLPQQIQANENKNQTNNLMNSTGYHSSGTNGGSMNQTKVQLKPIKEERTQRPPRANSRPSGQIVGHVSNKK